VHLKGEDRYQYDVNNGFPKQILLRELAERELPGTGPRPVAAGVNIIGKMA
jgi:hypothetical protein